MRVLIKGSKEKLSKNLTQDEVDCNCISDGCRATLIQEELIETFQKFRDHLGCPIYMTNSYRCQYYNNMKNGSVKSRHIIGGAMDLVKPPYIDIEDFAKAARLFFGFVKVYKEENFIHCDIRSDIN